MRLRWVEYTGQSVEKRILQSKYSVYITLGIQSTTDDHMNMKQLPEDVKKTIPRIGGTVPGAQAGSEIVPDKFS